MVCKVSIGNTLDWKMFALWNLGDLEGSHAHLISFAFHPFNYFSTLIFHTEIYSYYVLISFLYNAFAMNSTVSYINIATPCFRCYLFIDISCGYFQRWHLTSSSPF